MDNEDVIESWRTDGITIASDINSANSISSGPGILSQVNTSNVVNYGALTIDDIRKVSQVMFENDSNNIFSYMQYPGNIFTNAFNKMYHSSKYISEFTELKDRFVYETKVENKVDVTLDVTESETFVSITIADESHTKYKLNVSDKADPYSFKYNVIDGILYIEILKY